MVAPRVRDCEKTRHVVPLLTRRATLRTGCYWLDAGKGSPAREQGDKRSDYFTDPSARGKQTSRPRTQLGEGLDAQLVTGLTNRFYDAVSDCSHFIRRQSAVRRPNRQPVGNTLAIFRK